MDEEELLNKIKEMWTQKITESRIQMQQDNKVILNTFDDLRATLPAAVEDIKKEKDIEALRERAMRDMHALVMALEMLKRMYELVMKMEMR